MDGVLLVFTYSLLTAVATGLGALPLLSRRFSRQEKWLGIGAAVAVGIMAAASVNLVIEGVDFSWIKTGAGFFVGVLFMHLLERYIHSSGHDYSIGDLRNADALRAILIVGVMTLHSFAEGVGIGVSFGGTISFGIFISIAIAVHNIPEGLAISLIMVPRGTPVWKAALWSIFSSLPQPLMAVPAYLFTTTFESFLPFGLGFAAGAMIWMIIAELIPESLEKISFKLFILITSAAVVGMTIFQMLIN